MKIIGWNINGIRGKSMSVLNKDKTFNTECELGKLISNYDPDVICFGETKCQGIHTSMFDCLSHSTDIPKIMVMGNHDFKAETTYLDDQDPCSSTDLQLALFDDKEFIANKLFFIDHKVDDTLFLFINTNLYDDDEDNLLEYVLCMQSLYSSLFNVYVPKSILEIPDDKQRSLAIVEFFKDFQETQIKNYCQSILKKYKINNIFFCGHHPMYGVKTKVKNEITSLKSQQLNLSGLLFIQDIIDLFYSINNQVRLYYLSADVHLYQKSLIYFDKFPYTPIEHIIIGTGGTDLDLAPYKKLSSTKDKYNIMNINIIDTDADNHGFLLTKRKDNYYINDFISIPTQ